MFTQSRVKIDSRSSGGDGRMFSEISLSLEVSFTHWFVDDKLMVTPRKKINDFTQE